MNRSTTAPLVRSAFERWCRVTGVRQAQGNDDVGAYILDQQQTGWQVNLLHENGAVSAPFGYNRYTAPAMFDMLRFATDTAALAVKQNVTVVIMSPLGDPETVTAHLYNGLLEDDVAENLAAEDQCAEEKEATEQMEDPFNNEPADYLIHWNFTTLSMIPKEQR